jgi:hypothetical protein
MQPGDVARGSFLLASQGPRDLPLKSWGDPSVGFLGAGQPAHRICPCPYSSRQCPGRSLPSYGGITTAPSPSPSSLAPFLRGSAPHPRPSFRPRSRYTSLCHGGSLSCVSEFDVDAGFDGGKCAARGPQRSPRLVCVNVCGSRHLHFDIPSYAGKSKAAIIAKNQL